MPKSINITLFICLCLTSTAFAQYSLEEFPVPVGGHITDDAGLPIENASVTFIDQTSSNEYTGTTDASGWYGNLGYSAVPNAPRGQILGNAHPNPFGKATTIDIQTSGHEKSIGSVGEIDIYDVRGRLVSSIPASNGSHEVITTSGALANGTYFYRFAGETRKMVGSPKFITIKSASSSGSEKSVVEYGIEISAAGYENLSGLVSLDDNQANYQDYDLEPESAQSRAVAIKVFNISATEQLMDGAVTLSWGDYVQTESAGADSVFNFLIPAGVDSLSFGVSGFAGHDHESQIFSVLNPDSLAVRGWLADDEMTMAVGVLPGIVYLELVPEIRLDEPDFMESVGGVAHRFEDVRFVLYTMTEESDWTVPANETTLNKLRTARDEYFTIIDADGSNDNIQLIGYTSAESDTIPEWEFDDFFDPNDNTMWYRHDIYVCNDCGPPGNSHQDWDSDGDVDNSISFIPDYSSLGDAREEILNPNVLYDNEIGILEHIGDPEYRRDIVNTSLKSRLGRDFDPNK